MSLQPVAPGRGAGASGRAQPGALLRGHRVTLFAPLDDPADAPDGVDLEPAGRSIGVRANGSVAPVSLSVPAARRSLQAVRAAEPDVVHVHEPFAPGLTYGLLARRPRQPLVATFHRSGPSGWYAALRPLTGRLAAHLALRCAVSEAARATAEDALGGTYRVLFNGVEVDRYRAATRSAPQRPSVLFLGRHEERKGLPVLLAAFEHLLARRGPTDVEAERPELWVAGDGPATATLRHRYPGSADLHWLGVLSEGDKTRRLASARVLCAPSLGGESFGMVLLEAMAAGAVVVASDIDGYRQVADGHAVLVPPGEVDALSRALEGVLSGALACSPGSSAGEGREQWVADASARADQWSMARLAASYEELYRSVLVGSGS